MSQVKKNEKMKNIFLIHISKSVLSEIYLLKTNPASIFINECAVMMCTVKQGYMLEGRGQ